MNLCGRQTLQAVLLIAVAGCAQSGFAVCDATWADRPTLFESEVRIKGRGQYVRRLLLPPGQEAIVIATEQGIDVTLTVTGDDASLSADSPLRRFGVQRAIIRPATATGHTALIRGKEQESVSGVVHLRIVGVPSESGAADCVAAHRMLAKADAAYAQGEAIRNQVDDAGPGNAGDAYRASTEGYGEALVWLERAKAVLLLAQTQLALASASYQGTQDWAAAEHWAKRAAVAYQSSGNVYGAAKARAMRAAALMELAQTSAMSSGNLAMAGTLLEQAAAFHAARGEPHDQALAINNLGLTRYLGGDYLEATRLYRVALDLYRMQRDQTRQAQVMGNLALVEYELGNLKQANAVYADLLGLIDEKASPALHVNVLNNSALTLTASGESDRALELYEQALAAAQRMQDGYYEAVSLQGMGTLYELLGDSETALAHYQRALALRPAEVDASQRIETLWSIANIQRLKGQGKESLALDMEALAIAATPLDKARVRLQMAADYTAQGRQQDVMATIQTLLTQRVPGDDLIRARALLLRGRMLSRSDSKAAESDLRAALRIFRQFDFSTEEFNSLVALAQTLGDRGDGAAALRQIDTALALAEQMRLQSANPELRATLMQSTRSAFDVKIALLAKDYFAARSPATRRALALQGLETAEQGRARSLLDFERIDFSDTPEMVPLLAKRRELYAALGQYRIRFDASAGVVSADDTLLDAIRRNMADTKRQLDQIDAQLAGRSKSAANRPLASLQIGALPHNAVFIEYWLGATEAYAWVVTRDTLSMVHLGLTSRIVDAAIEVQQGLRDFASNGAESRIVQLDTLSALVWHPVRDHIRPGRALVFVPDAVLHYIPFAALLNKGVPRRFLIEDHDVATAPSLGLLLAERAGGSVLADRLLMVSDPIYDTDGRATPVTLRRLQGTAREADAIVALVSADRTDRLEGLEATRESFLRAPFDRYRYIHVASHAVADARIPQLSALLLTPTASLSHRTDGRVLAADLMNVRLNADLVVLSACDTALGRMVGSEGVIGLRYVMLARGARAVASSLWRVGDRMTAEFMSRFYESMFVDRSTSLAALSTAMRTTMEERGPDPALWAAFELSIRDASLIL